MKSVLWRVAERLFYIEDARCLKFKWILEKYVAGMLRAFVQLRIRIKSLAFVNEIMNLCIPLKQ